jgi:exosortase
VTAVAPARPFSPGRVRSGDKAPWLDFALLAAAAGVALVPCARFWNANPDYFFGWGVPFLAGYLFYERWAERPAPPSAPKNFSPLACGAILIFWALLLLADRMLAETEPGWRPGLWLEMGLVVGAMLAWCGLSGGGRWVRHFAFPIGFLFLGVPWIFNLELPVVQGLMRFNAARVADSLVLLDVPARAAGNTLELATGALGIEEACSGIRSLQAALTMSLFLGEFYRLAPKKRLLLPLLAVLLALAGNYLRLLFLAWHGARGGAISVESLHDSAGFGILAFTVVGLWLTSLALRGSATPTAPLEKLERSVPPGRRRIALRWAMGLLLAAIASEGLTRDWYAWREKTEPRFPAWVVAWPADAKDFRSVPIPPATRDLLEYDEARAGTWRDQRDWRWNAFWFRYRPATGNKIVLDSHNPEICLPGAGLREVGGEGLFPVTVRGIALSVRAYLFASASGDEHVFWIAYRNRGNVAGFGERPGVYGRSLHAFFQRTFDWARDAWDGCRGADAETLEVTVAGPADADSARRACVVFLTEAVQPEESRPAGTPAP